MSSQCPASPMRRPLAVLAVAVSARCVLENVQLYDANDTPVTEWTPDDLSLGKSVFNQDGRIEDIAPPPAVREPATVELMLTGLCSVAGVARRRRR